MRGWTVALLAAGALLPAGSLAADEKKPAPAAADAACCCCDAEPLRVGAVAYGPSVVTAFRAMRLHFARHKMPISFTLYDTYDAMTDALAKRHIDVAWNTPLAHAKFHLRAGGSKTLVMRDVDVGCRVVLVARKDAGVAAPADLPGKALVLGSCDAADATVLPLHFLRKQGIDMDRVKVVSLHAEVDAKGNPCSSERHVLVALLKGRGQAGVIGVGLWKRLQEQQPEQAAQLRAVWTSPPFSHCVFTARKNLNADTAARFTKLMLAMDGRDPLGATMLRLEGCSRWVPAGAAEQAGFAELLSALNSTPKR